MIALSKLLLVVLVSGLLSSCLSPTMSPECRDFFSRPASQSEKLFRTYELDQQLELYRCGMNRRPPDSSLPILIAERGGAVIPPLLDKLDAEQDELFQYAIIDIFLVLSIKGHLRDRRDVVDHIRQVVAKMKVPAFREMAQDKLSQIEKNSLG